MNKLKKEKGITLIALIITIVVLLILAVVAIGAAQDSNIVGYAQNAAGQYEEGKAIENNTIAGYENLLSQYANGIVPGGNNSGGNNGGGNSGGSNTPNQPINYLGKYVKYDSNGDGSVADETILWRVLRDDADKVELISANVLGTAAEDQVNLTPTSFDDARNKYNGAVQTIVQKCIDLTGISSVRSIGGPATDTTETVVFGNLAPFKPQEGEDFTQYEGENGLKVGDDTYYSEDWNQMQRAGVVQADNLQEYWLASRYVYVDSYYVSFYVRYCNTYGSCYDGYLCFVRSSADSYYISDASSRGVRPVLTLESGILEGKTGGETSSNPIEIY